uniref:Solute carrier family 35 member B4 n=1 Tax=Sus scrofa TaxID=9823 RepID=A0A8D1V106_PIG
MVFVFLFLTHFTPWERLWFRPCCCAWHRVVLCLWPGKAFETPHLSGLLGGLLLLTSRVSAPQVLRRHGGHVLHGQRGQQLRPEPQHRHASAHDIPIRFSNCQHDPRDYHFEEKTSQSSSSENDGFQAFAWWLLGIGALTFALLMSARMGIFQETLYRQFGKHSKEALFYNHALPLPGFIFLASDIYDHAVLFNKSELYQVPVVGVTVPIMWFYLFMNVITQYVCIRGVFTLTTECTSLTVTLVVTLRKFVSLIFSILYFRNPFTLWHWLGTVFVFLGTLMYTEVWSNLGPPKGQPPKEDKRN